VLTTDAGEYIIKAKLGKANSVKGRMDQVIFMNLKNAEIGKEYIILEINTDDEELNSFLFSLGCYSGEPITVISRSRSGCVVSIKDGRYNIDNYLAEAITV